MAAICNGSFHGAKNRRLLGTAPACREQKKNRENGKANHSDPSLGDHAAAWSPDGERIAYANGNNIYVCNRDGNGNRKLVGAEGTVEWPRWSPDGGALRFTVIDSRAAAQSIWEVHSDGLHLAPLLPRWNNPSAECSGNWTPDGKYFVFQSTRNGRTDIWMRSEEPGFLRRSEVWPLTSGGLNYLSPVASRDGKQIFVIGAKPRGELARFDERTEQFVPYLPEISGDGLDFSAYGQSIAYVAVPEGTVWRCRMDGTDRHQLTDFPLRAFEPRWSPDGRHIAFAGLSPGHAWNIYLVSSDGGGLRQLTTGERGEVDVGWSADGKSLVFGDVVTLSGPAPVVHLLDLATDRTSLIKTKGVDFPNWSRDGKYIYFEADFGGPAMMRIRITDGKLEKIASTAEFRRANSFFGEWSGLTPDGSPLILRDIGSQEIYALDWSAR